MTERKDRLRKEKLLKDYTTLEKTIQELKDRYEEVYTVSTKITPSYSEGGGNGGGFDGSKVENNCIKLLEIDLKLDKLKERKRKIDNDIRNMTYLQRKVVNYVDIENHSIYQCAKMFKRDYNDIKRVHNRALDSMTI